MTRIVRLSGYTGVALVSLLTGCGVLGGAQADEAPASPTPSPSHSWDLQPISGDYDPADHAAAVVEECGPADVDPVLLMAVLYNESYKPHDPELEREWHDYDPESGFGIANMHEDAFNDVKSGRDFADRQWDELPDDPQLAVKAAAWYLYD
ncbi:MAG: lytic transglycosylase domain-containing protein, partial [Stackebrandtia sp.]